MKDFGYLIIKVGDESISDWIQGIVCAESYAEAMEIVEEKYGTAIIESVELFLAEEENEKTTP